MSKNPPAKSATPSQNDAHNKHATHRYGPGSASRATQEDDDSLSACPGNTMGGASSRTPPHSSRKSHSRLPSSSSKSPESRKYWETVLDPRGEGPASGSTSASKSPSGKSEKPYQCSVCPLNFKKRCNLVTHVSNVHENIRPFLCPICRRTFARKSNCVKHVSFLSSFNFFFFFYFVLGVKVIQCTDKHSCQYCSTLSPCR